jgi:hypothetical protein
MRPVDVRAYAAYLLRWDAPEPGTPEAYSYVELGKGQADYQTLPALRGPDSRGRTVTVWEPDAEELAALCSGGRIVLAVLTFGQPFQPVTLSVIGGNRELRVGAGEEE